ncbi:hypothetical protein Hanom_Chr00s083383g01795251 [Helianthus anomalus]
MDSGDTRRDRGRGKRRKRAWVRGGRSGKRKGVLVIWRIYRSTFYKRYKCIH